MAAPDQVHAHPQSRDRDESIRDNTAPVQTTRIEISERTLSIIAIVLSAFSLGLVILALILGQIAEREARLAQYDAQLMRAKLQSMNIETDDHAEEKRK